MWAGTPHAVMFRGNVNVYFKELLINVRVFHSMNKKSVFARRLAEDEGRCASSPSPLVLPIRPRAPRAHFRLTRFSSRSLQSHFAPLMDSYIITGASRSRITLDKYHRERKDMKFSGDKAEGLQSRSSPLALAIPFPFSPLPRRHTCRFSLSRFPERGIFMFAPGG